jgi:hypothetical protein
LYLAGPSQAMPATARKAGTWRVHNALTRWRSLTMLRRYTGAVAQELALGTRAVEPGRSASVRKTGPGT